jgi:large subunit ribosomal protein L29
MKAKDLRERTTAHLQELEKQLTGDAFQARFKNFTNRLDDTSQIKKLRRDVARVKTLLGELTRKPVTVTAKVPHATKSAPAALSTSKPAKAPAKKSVTKAVKAAKSEAKK